MKRLIHIFFAAAVLAAASSCDRQMDPLDKPYVTISDEDGMTSMNILATASGLQTTLTIALHSRLMDHDITVGYRVTPGDGIREGTDFTMKQKLEGTVTFVPGVFTKNLYFNWFPNPALDASKDCTVRVQITSCSDPEVTIGELRCYETTPIVKDNYIYKRILK